MKQASISFEKAVEIALEQHRSGNFGRAEALYMEILRQDPGNVDAMHLLGVLAHQGRKPETAVQLIAAAISRRPDVAIFHYNLAEAYSALDRRSEALASYQRAVELDPDYYEAHNNLGNLLNLMGKHAQAEVSCRHALELESGEAAPYNNLGNSLRWLDRRAEAIDAYRKAIEIRPNFSEAMNNLALCLCAEARFDEGIQQFRKAIELDPSKSDLHNNMGVALTRQRQFEQAAASFQTAIDIDPKHAQAHSNLGSALQGLNKAEFAIPLYEEAIRLKPDFLDAHSNLASALSTVGRKDEALTAIDEALQLKPRARDYFQRGTILRELGRPDEGIEEYRRALELEPDNVAVTAGLGYALQERGELDEAMSALNRSIELHPDPQMHSNVLMTINYHPGYTPQALLDAHKTWARMHEDPHRPAWAPHPNDRSPDRKLRIGYVSPDFRSHSVSYFLEPILESHDHSQFEICAYAHLAGTDMSTWRLRAQIDQWRETSGLAPDKIAEQIRTDQIDILIELAGHTANNSLTVFARRPAPVQINMIGFPSTTGLSTIDYRITDELCDPTGVTDRFNTESLIRMPNLFWCYSPPFNSPEIGPLPADSGVVTFTCVNNFTKVTPDVQQMWASLLVAVPNSRLILQTSALASRQMQKMVLERFAKAGVGPDRLDFRKATGLVPYLQLLEQSDMTLDPFPFNGGTTTCHSLWMGAPVITLAGDRHASRMGLSMMTAIGLPEFVAHTPDEYLQIAVRFANDLPRLREIRAGMRERLKASPLLDAVGYTRNLEVAFRQVWRNWCATSSIGTT